MFPVVAYAPSAATKPSIAIQPLNFSASGVIVLRLIGVEFVRDLLSQNMPGITQPVKP
jgi:hypothetical protein